MSLKSASFKSAFRDVGPADPFWHIEAGLGLGMRVASRRGEIPVQRLTTADQVIALAAGSLRPVAAVRHGRTGAAIRVAAHAFGAGRPHHELILGPQTPIRTVDEFGVAALVPLESLLNQTTITWLAGTDHELWGVELGALPHEEAEPDVIMVEGLGIGSLGSDVAPGTEVTVRAIRRRLADQAMVLGWRRGTDADLHVVASSRRLSPALSDGSTLAFDIPDGESGVWLRSTAAVPRDVEPDSEDSRLLGVAISRIAFEGDEIALDDVRVGEGFYELEQEAREGEAGPRWRWTNGNARLYLSGAGRLEITLHLIMKPWLPPVGEPPLSVDAADSPGCAEPAPRAWPPLRAVRRRLPVSLPSIEALHAD